MEREKHRDIGPTSWALLGSVISSVITPISRFTLPETNSLHMKIWMVGIGSFL